MIQVEAALDGLLPVAAANALAESLKDDRRFTVEATGASTDGLPIRHVCFADHDRLARGQLDSGLRALNAMLEARGPSLSA